MNVMFIILVFFISQNLVCSEKKNWQSEMPRTRLKDIYGLKEAKEEFYFLRDCILDPKKLKIGGIKKFQKGCLVEGRPGNGKTEIVRAFAGEMSFPFFYVKASTFGDIYQNSGAKNIASFFEAVFSACEKNSEGQVTYNPVIVFIDNLDMIGSRNNDKSNLSDRRAICSLKGCIDKINQRNMPIYFFGATCIPSVIDPALLSRDRFGGCTIVIPEPDEETIREIIKNSYSFKTVPLDEIIDISIQYKNFELSDFIEIIIQFHAQKDLIKKREILLELLTKLFFLHQNNDELVLSAGEVIKTVKHVPLYAYQAGTNLKLCHIVNVLDEKFEAKKNR